MVMNKFLFVLFCFVSFSINAQERLKVTVPSDEESEVSELLDCLKEAINNEDLGAYNSLLTSKFASKNKKKNAILFMESDLEIEVNKFTITENDSDHIGFVVKYTHSIDGQSYNIVSEVTAKRTDDGLLLDDEDVISKKNSRGNRVADCPDGNCPLVERVVADCPDGNCPVNRPANAGKDNRTVPIFVNENGEPDPNGMMWLDPKALLKTFPEKYPRCKNCR